MTKKRKIGLVVPDLSIYGGVPAVAKFLYDVISASDDFEAELISLATSSKDRNSFRLLKPQTWLHQPTVTKEFFQGISYRHVGANFTEIEYFRYQPRQILDQILNEFDLIQVVAGTPPWLLAAKNCSAPLVLQVATLSRVERESMISRQRGLRNIWIKIMTKLNSYLETSAFHRADSVLVENNWLFNVLKAKSLGGLVALVTPGVDVGFYCLSEVKRSDFILAVGRFDDPRKNVGLLLEAFNIFSERVDENPKLVLAGKTAPAEKDLRMAETLGISDRLTILTDLSDENLRELYQSARFFALSSNEEGLGLVLLEAMACGLPIVATRCGGAEEVVVEGETGFLVEKGNPSALAEKMSELWQNATLRDKMREKGRKRAVEKFSKPVKGEAFLQIYRNLLDGRAQA